MTDVLGYLQSKEIPLWPGTDNNVHTLCWYHDEEPGKRGRLYINVDPDADPPGLFTCFRCGEKGGLNKLRKHFGDPPLGEEEVSEAKLAVLEAATEYCYQALLAEGNEDHFFYLRNERGLPIEVIEKARLGYDDGSLVQHLLNLEFSLEDIRSTGLVKPNGSDFLDGCIVIPYIQNGNVVMIRGRAYDGDAKYKTPTGQGSRPYNVDAIVAGEDVILTEGEFDALVLQSLGFNAIGVPGANQWNQKWNTLVEDCARVYICFDNDEAGKAGAEKASNSIGAKARIVEMPVHEPGENKNDPTEWIVNKGHDKDDFTRLLIAAARGLLVTVEEAFDEWLENEGNPDRQGLELGYLKLDESIRPGFMPGQVMVTLAKTGVGKTVWALNTMYRMMVVNPDLKVLFVSLEQTRNEWYERARRIYRFYNMDLPEEEINRHVINHYRNNIRIVDKNRITEEELVDTIDQFTAEVGAPPQLTVVDYLGYFARGYKGEPYQRTSDAIMSLKAVAKDRRISILAPHQVSRSNKAGEEIDLSDARDSGVVEETADYLFALVAKDQRIGQEASENTGSVHMRIKKSRHGGANTDIAFQFAPFSLTMVPIIDNLFDGSARSYVDMAKDEMQMYNLGERRIETVMKMHRTGDRSLLL